MKHVCILTVFSSPQGNGDRWDKLNPFFFEGHTKNNFATLCSSHASGSYMAAVAQSKGKITRVASQLQKIESITSPMAKKLLGVLLGRSGLRSKGFIQCKDRVFKICFVSERRRDFSGFETWIPFFDLHAFFERKICKFKRGCLAHKMFCKLLRQTHGQHDHVNIWQSQLHLTTGNNQQARYDASRMASNWDTSCHTFSS